MGMSKRVEYTVWVTLSAPAFHVDYDHDRRPINVTVDGEKVVIELEPTVQSQGVFTLDLADLRRIVDDATV